MSADDVAGITKAVALYSHIIDGKEWERIDQVFAPDGVFVNSRGSYEGVAAIVQFLSTTEQPIVHMSSNHVIDINGDGRTATGRVKWLVFRSDMSLLAGEYSDLYVKLQAGWRIVRRAASLRAPRKT